MNKVKIYDKKNRLSTSLNLLFGIYTFYKYKGKNVHEIKCTHNGMLSYSLTTETETKVLGLSGDKLTLTKESDNKKKEFTYNSEINTLRKKLEVEVESGKSLIIDDYTDKDGVTKRGFTFNFNEKTLNTIKNGKSKN